MERSRNRGRMNFQTILRWWFTGFSYIYWIWYHTPKSCIPLRLSHHHASVGVTSNGWNLRHPYGRHPLEKIKEDREGLCQRGGCFSVRWWWATIRSHSWKESTRVEDWLRSASKRPRVSYRFQPTSDSLFSDREYDVANLSLLLARHRRSSARGNRLTEMPRTEESLFLLKVVCIHLILCFV